MTKVLTRYKLGDLIEVTRGQSLAGDYYAESGEYIRLTLANFDYQNGGFKDDTQKTDIYYTGPVRQECLLNEGDIITPLTEQALGLLGSTARIPVSGKFVQSGDVALIKCNEELIDPSFCYYLLPSAQVKSQLAAGSQQTKIRHTSPDAIKACIVDIPCLEDQRKIGRIMDSITGKISLNRSINKELEQMAKEIYDYWFVQFDFPDENGRPYKSSGGAMVYNTVLKKDIPEGWEVKSCKDITSIKTGKEDANFSTESGIYPFFTCSKDNLKCDSYAFEGSAVLIAGNGDFNVKHFSGKFNAYQRTYVLIPEHKYYGALYFASVSKIDFFRRNSNGSVVKFITKGDVENICVFECNNESIYNQLNTLIKEIESLNMEIEELSSITKDLLPILMTGQAKIKE